MNKPEAAQRIHSDERMVGQRAFYHVYYRHNGKPRFAPVWATNMRGLPTEKKASDWFEGVCKELRWKNVEIIKVVTCDPNVAI